jgi:hypothetical protein
MHRELWLRLVYAAQSVINQGALTLMYRNLIYADLEPVTWEEGEDEIIMDAMQLGGTVTEIVT